MSHGKDILSVSTLDHSFSQNKEKIYCKRTKTVLINKQLFNMY